MFTELKLCSTVTKLVHEAQIMFKKFTKCSCNSDNVHEFQKLSMDL